LPNELWIAGAGSGKTHKIIQNAIDIINAGGRVLVVTYTVNNQAELRSRFIKMYGKSSDNFIVKGLLSFYLEDIVRPYQSVIFPERIAGITFTENNPHLIPGTTTWLPNRQERIDRTINPLHYLTPCKTSAYSGLLAKLAALVSKMANNAPAKRLNEIYQRIFFDEVQDLVGWDYDVIKSLSNVMPDSICCVGDFRQTIYTTTFGQKKPLTRKEKIQYFSAIKFQQCTLSKNRRCIQRICDLSDLIHPDSDHKTESEVKKIPEALADHHGVFAVRHSQVREYLDTYNPQVLRWSSTTGKKFLPEGLTCYSFGTSKGLGFDRVLVIAPEKHLNFLSGDHKAFDKDKTEESRNKLYVAITRARYSLAFAVEEKLLGKLPFPLWNRAGQ
jgi:superfamily I DNA/RNA helicase